MLQLELLLGVICQSLYLDLDGTVFLDDPLVSVDDKACGG
jgi:hypothetical protein